MKEHFCNQALRLIAITLVLNHFLAPESLAEKASSASLDGVPEVYLGFGTTYEPRPAEDSGALRIDVVAPGSPADRAGLRKGDRIESFNGNTFRFRDDADGIRSLTWARAGVPIKLGILRQGKAQTLSMVPVQASRSQRLALAEHLENLDRCREQGDCASCAQPADPQADISFAIRQQVIAAGGKASIRAERSGDTPDLKYSAEDIRLPANFDLSPWQHAESMARSLEPGEALVLDFSIDDKGRSRIDVRVER